MVHEDEGVALISPAGDERGDVGAGLAVEHQRGSGAVDVLVQRGGHLRPVDVAGPPGGAERAVGGVLALLGSGHLVGREELFDHRRELGQDLLAEVLG